MVNLREELIDSPDLGRIFRDTWSFRCGIAQRGGWEGIRAITGFTFVTAPDWGDLT